MKLIIVTAIFFIASGIMDISIATHFSGKILSTGFWTFNPEQAWHFSWYLMWVCFLYSIYVAKRSE